MTLSDLRQFWAVRDGGDPTGGGDPTAGEEEDLGAGDEEEEAPPEGDAPPEEGQPSAEQIEARALEIARAKGWTEPAAPAKVEDQAPEVPDFWGQASQEAAKYGKDELWAYNRALALAGEDAHRKASQDSQAQVLEARKPAIEAANLEDVKRDMPDLDEDDAKFLARTMTETLYLVGPAAFDTGHNEKDPTVKAQKMAAHRQIADFARLYALGKLTETQRKAQRAESSPTPGKPAPVSAKGVVRGPTTGLTADDKAWLKEWETKKNGGKPATKEQIEEFRSRGIFVGS